MSREGKYDILLIGTSAGGLYVLTSLLDGLSDTYPLPIAIVQHRLKEQGHLLEEILQTHCSLQIRQADEKEKIKSGYAYIAPPDYHLLIESDRSFSLSCEKPVSFSRPSIDVLFESAALAYGSRAAAILLTGANRDGASGIAAIARAGGLTIAQDPGEAEFPFMPAAAIATGQVTHVMKLDAIRKFILTNGRLVP